MKISKMHDTRCRMHVKAFINHASIIISVNSCSFVAEYAF